MTGSYYELFGNIVKQAIIDYQDYFRRKEEIDIEFWLLYESPKRKMVNRNKDMVTAGRFHFLQRIRENGMSAEKYLFGNDYWSLEQQIKRYGIKLNLRIVREYVLLGERKWARYEKDNRNSVELHGNNPNGELREREAVLLS